MGFHNNEFIGDRLAEAREYNRFSRAALADRINVSRQTISAIEKGIQNPNPENLLKIARELKFPIEYFYAFDQQSSPKLNTITFRKKSNTAAGMKRKAELYDQWFSNIVTQLGHYIDFPTYQFAPRQDLDYQELDKEDIELLSSNTREQLGISNGPISNLTTLLESKGIFLGVTDIPVEIDAFSVARKDIKCIYMNYTDHKAVRNRFNSAHELGHLILHQLIDDSDYEDHYKLIEAQANRFASAFLMPRQTFAKEFYSLEMNHLMRLKERWKVSIQAIAYRAKDLRLISVDQYNAFQRRFSYAGYRKVEPLDDIIIVEKPTMLKKAIELVFSNGIFDGQSLFSATGVPIHIIALLTNTDERIMTGTNNVIDFNIQLK